MTQGASLDSQPDHQESVFDPAQYSAEELQALFARLQAENTALKQRLSNPDTESQLRIVLENMPIMLFAIDDDGQCTAWNRESERVTGYSAQEVIGLRYELI